MVRIHIAQRDNVLARHPAHIHRPLLPAVPIIPTSNLSFGDIIVRFALMQPLNASDPAAMAVV